MKKVLPFVLLVALFSCKPAIDKTISKDSFNDDVKTIIKENAKDYTKEDFAEFREDASNKITSQMLGINKGQNITYKEILDTVKAHRLRNEAEISAYNRAVDELKTKIELHVIKAGMTKGDYDIGDYFVATFTIKNISGKPISAYDGTIFVIDPMKNELAKLNESSNKTIAPSEVVQSEKQWNIFQHPSQLQETPFEKLKFEWQINKIVFEDGTTMEAPRKPAALRDNN